MEQCVLSCKALGSARVVRLEGREALDTISRFEVEVLSDDAALDLAALLGEEAGLVLSDGESTRAIPLVVTGAAWAGEAKDGQRYALSLAPKAHVLELRHGHEIFQEKTTQEIVQEIFSRAGLGALRFRLAGQYQKRVYCVRYGETEWGFATRLLADEGISLFFDQTAEGDPEIVFADHDGSHASIEGGPAMLFEEGSGMMRTPSLFFDLEKTTRLVHDKVHVRDFDVRQPDVLIEGEAGDGPLEHYEFPAHVPSSDAAKARAAVRLEQLQRDAEVLTGRTLCARLGPGRLVTIEGAVSEAFSGEHLITSVSHRLVQASRSDDRGSPYVAEVTLVPFGRGRTMRPALPARVRVDGIETAIVTGAPGEEIHVDDLGCIKVRFRWDRSGKGDDTTSRWVRTLQLNMFSSMILPRVGFEVPIVYVDGSPDLPVALGRLYGGSAATPYGLPGKKGVATLQSASSPGGGTTHEIRLTDDAGSMETFIHATKDQSIGVGGTHTTTVGVDATHDVKKSYEVSIKGPQKGTISANQDVVVGANMEITVKGARSVTVGGMEMFKVTGTKLVEVKGAAVDLVGAAHLLQCNQSNTVVQGVFVQTVGGPMALTAGLGANRSFAAVFGEQVGGARAIKAASRCVDSVKGTKNVTSGISKDKAGAKVVTKAKGAGSIKATAAKITAGGKLAISGSVVTIKAGGGITVKAGGKLTIKGKVSPKGSKLKLDASKTTKKSGSKVGS
jgi:type VI secretion system secreted protein VgrG